MADNKKMGAVPGLYSAPNNVFQTPIPPSPVRTPAWRPNAPAKSSGPGSFQAPKTPRPKA